jgi:hypothetical protein
MTNSEALAPTTTPLDPRVVQEVLLGGDLARLTPEQRVSFYRRVCESLGLNPLTKPFDYLKLNGREILYAKKDATDQLRFLHRISIDPKGFTREILSGIYVVTATATMPSGRTDVSTGAVAVENLKGESRANAMMKAETKAKRRVTLSICGLGLLDETEVDSIPDAQRDPVSPPLPIETVIADDPPDLDEEHAMDPTTGEVVDLQPDQFHIREVFSKRRGTTNGRPWELFIVRVHTGAEFQTFDKKIVELCREAEREARPLQISTAPAKRGDGIEITRAHRLFGSGDEKIL